MIVWVFQVDFLYGLFVSNFGTSSGSLSVIYVPGWFLVFFFAPAAAAFRFGVFLILRRLFTPRTRRRFSRSSTVHIVSAGV